MKILITGSRGYIGSNLIEYLEKNDPRQKLFKYIVKSKWTLVEMNPKNDNLEDIFRKPVGRKKYPDEPRKEAFNGGRFK